MTCHRTPGHPGTQSGSSPTQLPHLRAGWVPCVPKVSVGSFRESHLARLWQPASLPGPRGSQAGGRGHKEQLPQEPSPTTVGPQSQTPSHQHLRQVVPLSFLFTYFPFPQKTLDLTKLCASWKSSYPYDHPAGHCLSDWPTPTVGTAFPRAAAKPPQVVLKGI